MPADSLTTEAKARLFDQLVAHQPTIAEALVSHARTKAGELIISHKAGLRAGGRGRNQADFGLEALSAVHEILTGSRLGVDQIVQDVRVAMEANLTFQS